MATHGLQREDLTLERESGLGREEQGHLRVHMG
ncbi:hypothetical protein CCACVL1_08425 [Corchorus capsularis]|uniref:Uncharacterized protein n=1 Tax=Corchorus capsularis TaxID=210143 RepID=A0A1R3J0S1_COCAP|nr:hypothetical protein CCACVL1_08425 [Corchorus capsularis]